jgi:hypothetical protein
MWHVQAPDAMRSLASALQLLTNALGNFLATAVTLIITDVSAASPNTSTHTHAYQMLSL